jgi:hypothetical protein
MTDILILKMQLAALEGSAPGSVKAISELLKMYDIACYTENETMQKVTKDVLHKTMDDYLLNRKRSFEIIKQLPPEHWPKPH